MATSRAGKILILDLTTGKTETRPTSEYARDYLGAQGIAYKLFFDMVPPDTHPYDPANMICFNVGPLTGTLLGTRCQITTKSPMNSNYALVDSGVGGSFPAELKFAGYDHVVVKGKAKEPVYIHIENDDIEIRDATHIWGLDTQQTQDAIRKDLGDPDVQIACIGQAGENMVVWASIVHDVSDTCAHGGYGAVMGSKNLKALAVRGTKGVKIADPQYFKQIWDLEWYGLHNINEGRGGSEWVGQVLAHHGDTEHYELWFDNDMWPWGFPGRTFITPPRPDGKDMYNSEHSLVPFRNTYGYNLGCAFCPFQCQNGYVVPGIGCSGATCFLHMMFRGTLKNQDLGTWFKAVSKVNHYGMDCIDPSWILGWLMDLYERGLITAEDTDGIPMEWGSEEAILAFLDKVALQEGFGKLFKDGFEPAARVIAGGEGIGTATFVANSAMPFYFLDVETMPAGPVGLRILRTLPHFMFAQPPADRNAMYQLIATYYDMSEEEAYLLQEGWLEQFCIRYCDGIKDAFRFKEPRGAAYYYAESDVGTLTADLCGHCDWKSDRGAHLDNKWGPAQASEDLNATTGEGWTEEKVRDAVRRVQFLQHSYNYMCEHVNAHPVFVGKEFIRSLAAAVPNGKFKGDKLDIKMSAECGRLFAERLGFDGESGFPRMEELERLGMVWLHDKLVELEVPEKPPMPVVETIATKEEKEALKKALEKEKKKLKAALEA